MAVKTGGVEKHTQSPVTAKESCSRFSIGAERKSLGEVLYHSDLLVINLPETEGNKKFLDKEKINVKLERLILAVQALAQAQQSAKLTAPVDNKSIDVVLRDAKKSATKKATKKVSKKQ